MIVLIGAIIFVLLWCIVMFIPFIQDSIIRWKLRTGRELTEKEIDSLWGK